MDKNRKKQIMMEYKLQKVTGGVYRIVNTKNGRYLLAGDFDLQSTQNRLSFAKKTGSCVQPALAVDWAQYGPEAFEIEILEEIEMKEDQSRSSFKDQLKKLTEQWAEKFDLELAY